MVVLGLVLAVLAAASNATSNVLQRLANKQESPEVSFSPRLIWDLIHRKVWLAGLGTTTLSFLLQAAALSFAALAAVQPLIALELPLTLVGSSWVLGAQLHRREWVTIALMTGGLGMLIGFLHPAPVAHLHFSNLGWVVGLAAGEGLVLAFAGAAHLSHDWKRAAFFGAAAGLQFGLTAVIMKETMSVLPSGIGPLFSHWSTYALGASGLAAMLLVQAALNAGRLVAAQPGITLLDPLVAILWGVVGFHESIAGGLFLVAAGVGAVLMVAGAIGLSSSPVLHDGGNQADKERAAAST
ncbi:MAG TPA: DMT family transporter [Acidimicrobiales bacterium]|nr:DMT family transporter [Acidimicrobiales bacterium]